MSRIPTPENSSGAGGGAASSTQRRPTLDNYIARIDAAEKSFRRYVIEERDETAYMGGKRIIAEIRIETEDNIDGNVECKVFGSALTIEDIAPTPIEQAAIKAEVAANPFPKSVAAGKNAFLPPELASADPKHLCVFRNASHEILFIQWRRDGEKPDWPWSFWSDGKWRCMEPDGLLPLWGLDRLHEGRPIMIHEGAKGARDVQALVDAGGEARAKHPWGAELKQYIHIGWPGGAENSHRVDWGPIKALPPHRRVVIVTDNDQPGVQALTEISKILLRGMMAVRFDDRFPQHWDMADPFPRHEKWWRDGRYLGPDLENFLTPTTWATKEIKTTGDEKKKGRTGHTIRKEFANEWYWVKDPAVFVHRSRPDGLQKEDIFNRNVRPFSHVDNTARLLVRQLSSKVDRVAYRPERKPDLIIVEGGDRIFNTFRPTDVQPMQGDPAPWLDYMEHLVPDKSDRHELMKWCATLIARPDVKMLYSVLAISETQGVGKTTLGAKILSPLVGKWNTSTPSQQDLVDSQFNYWAAHKRLVVVNEIYTGHSRKAYDKLKDVITDPDIDVNTKNVPQYRIENFVHVFACSNSLRALHLDDEDRRWFVPGITEEKKPLEYWTQFNRWLEGAGLGIILRWALDWVEKPDNVVATGASAPKSAKKEEVVSESRSEGQQLAADLARHALDLKKPDSTLRKVIFTLESIRKLVAKKRGLELSDNHLERSLTLRKALREAGLFEPTYKGETPRFMIGEGMTAIVANFELGEIKGVKDLKSMGAELMEPGSPELWDGVKLVVAIVGDTPGGAIKVQVGRDRREVLLPKSEIAVKDLGGGNSEIVVPGWLAEKNGLTASEEEPPFRSGKAAPLGRAK